MAQTMFEKFYCLVLENNDTQEELRNIIDQATFIKRVVALGAAYGCHFGEEEVRAVMQANRRAWLERWIR
jgi:hypothetical protein